MKFFEDIHIGDRRELGRHTFTAEEIKRFAARFDPQVFHLDEEAATRSHFGGLVASGWHTGSIFIRLIVEHQQRVAAAMQARGEPLARTGPSPGFRNLRWIKPVYAGDTLEFVSEVSGKRELASRPDFGLVFSRNTAVNQNAVLVFEFESAVFVERRVAATGQ